MKQILLFLCLACVISIASSKYKKHYCDDDNRPESSTCFGENAVYEPTCGYYSKNCPFSVCGRYSSNPCDACSDPNVKYYEKHECEPEKVVNQCFKDMCNPTFDPQQPKLFEPVCGFRKGCKKGDCSKTFLNYCKACETSNYPWYQSGVCKDDRHTCKKSNYLKTSKSQAVCAFFDTPDGGVDQHTSVKNAQTACADSGVKFYTKGKCPGPNRDNSVYCLPHKRPSSCDDNYNPVCGFYLDENKALEHKIMSNACRACANKKIIYHQPGPCIFKCDRNPGVIYECDGVMVDPVCGSYKENGKTKKISLKNSCVGCYNIPIKIDTYTDGLCPGDEGIRCENDAGGFLIGYIFPVCGLFKEGCRKSSCRQTFAESVAACSNSDVVLFKAGLCPGDEGISCKPYRTRSTDDTDFIGSLTYQDVCGYTEKGCDSDSCRQDYDDQWAACGNASVQFFTKGPCP